ncbi:cutinase family protein [Nocardia africana]
MSRKRLPVVAVAAATGVIFLGPLGLPAATAHADGPDCRPYVIGVGGSQQRYNREQGNPTIIDGHLAAEAAKGSRVAEADYESSVWPVGPYTKDESIRDGDAVVARMIADYRAECPTGEVTVIGHSEGAQVASDSAPLADHVVTYGNPYDADGIYSQVPGIYPGASNSGVRPPAPNEKRVCHQYDWVCDAPAPWSDPVGFGLAVQGYASGWHYYAPGEADNVPEGSRVVVPEPSPNPNIPQSTPTGIPVWPQPMPSLPEWTPGPLPAVQDLDEAVQAVQSAVTPAPYTPTPLSDYIPDEVEQYVPEAVREYTPPPLPTVELPQVPALPALPDLGIRLP